MEKNKTTRGGVIYLVCNGEENEVNCEICCSAVGFAECEMKFVPHAPQRISLPQAISHAPAYFARSARNEFHCKNHLLAQCFLLGGGWRIRGHILASLGGKNRRQREKGRLPGSCIGGLTIDLSTKQKTTAYAVVFAWWGMVDSDHRSQ